MCPYLERRNYASLFFFDIDKEDIVLDQTTIIINNNKFIFIEEGEHSSGSIIRCKVLAHEVAKHSSSSLIRISIRSGDDVYYVNSNGSLIENPDTWIDAYKASSIISIPVSIAAFAS